MSEVHHGSTSMFGIFVLTIYSLVLIPYTIYYSCSASEDAAPVQPWTEKVNRLHACMHACGSNIGCSQSKKKKPSLAATIAKRCTKGREQSSLFDRTHAAANRRAVYSAGNLTLLSLWVIWFLLLWYVSATVTDMKPFDPFEILEIERTATDKEIKKAYRQLSLKYHPDKARTQRMGELRVRNTMHACV